MEYNPDMDEIIADSMTLIMDRAEQLNTKDQSAIGQEFREWLKEGITFDQVLTTTNFD